jgi:hypothetical protein
MTKDEIEHMWKVASNDPNHDTNWHDPVVIAFAHAVAAHTLLNIDPSSFMSYQEGFEAGNRLAVDGFCKQLRQLHDVYSLASDPKQLRARGQS